MTPNREVPAEPRLLHICGFPSSGTTLLRDILDVHPDLRIAGEMPLLPSLHALAAMPVTAANFDEIKAKFLATDVYGNFQNKGLSFEDLAGIFGASEEYRCAHLYAGLIDSGKFLYYGNKTPQYTESLASLLVLFPTTKVILIVRDIRDVALSFQKKWGKNGVLAAHKWATRMSLGLETLDRLASDQWLFMRYEDLLNRYRPELERVCTFLDVPFADEMLNHTEHRRVAFEGKKNLNSELDPSNLGKWKTQLSPGSVRRIEEVAYPVMQRFGYEPAFAKHAVPLTAPAKLLHQMNDAVAAVSAGNRYIENQSLASRLHGVAITLKRRLLVNRD